jgi:RNA polymerase sigma-70 factor (ECF subfamily)
MVQTDFDSNRLARRAAEGDAGAFARLVHEHSGLVYRVALRVLGENEAQDASQEAWVRVWRNLPSFRGESAFTTWLYRITVNTCLNERRKIGSRADREYAGDGAFPFLPAPMSHDSDPEAATLGSELRSDLVRALQDVRPEHRAALVLRHMEGLSYAEVAEVLGVPEGTAKGWVNRGRAALLVTLEKRAGEGRRGGAA